MPIIDYDEHCNRCGKSVRYTSWDDYDCSGFFGRKWDNDNVSIRQHKGDFICKECQ